MNNRQLLQAFKEGSRLTRPQMASLIMDAGVEPEVTVDVIRAYVHLEHHEKVGECIKDMMIIVPMRMGNEPRAAIRYDVLREGKQTPLLLVIGFVIKPWPSVLWEIDAS